MQTWRQMMMAKGEITVERAVHDALRDAAQNALDKYGIRIDSVQFQWIDASTHLGARHELRDVAVTTVTTT